MENPNGGVRQELEEYISQTPEISEEANYWFFRTEAGNLFEPFITSQSIAIGCPSVELATLEAIDPENRRDLKALTAQLKRNEPKTKRPGLSAGQLVVFTHVMKAGDYVIIPSNSTHQLAIGKILDDRAFEQPLVHERIVVPGFNKRRRVKWLKRISRDSVNPNLYQIFSAHQTISNVTSKSQWIDTLLFDFFKKGETYHYILEIDQTDGINARDLFQVCVDILNLADGFLEETGVNQDSGKIDTRINLNSPGDIELITSASKYIFVVGCIVLFLNGGGLKFKSEKLGIVLDISTDGLIKKISQFLNDGKNRKLSDSVNEKLTSLQVAKPDDIVKLITEINKGKK